MAHCTYGNYLVYSESDMDDVKEEHAAQLLKMQERINALRSALIEIEQIAALRGGQADIIMTIADALEKDAELSGQAT